MIWKPATASQSGNFPAATRSPTVNMTRSAGTGIGTPASIGSSSTRASDPLRPATAPFISAGPVLLASGLLVAAALRTLPERPPLPRVRHTDAGRITFRQSQAPSATG